MSRDIALSLIDPDPEQPRKLFDEAQIAELAQSMAANGLAVPILVRPVGERFVIVHGERRWRAATSLGWATIPAEVREVTADEAHWLSLIENIQRADLNPIEEAMVYRDRLAEGMTQQALGERVGKSQSHIATQLRFLKLPGVVQASLAEGKITEGHAKQLLRVENPAYRAGLSRAAVGKNLTVSALADDIDDSGEWAASYGLEEKAPDLHERVVAGELRLKPVRWLAQIRDAKAEHGPDAIPFAIYCEMKGMGPSKVRGIVTPMAMFLPDDMTREEWQETGNMLLSLPEVRAEMRMAEEYGRRVRN
jgi:ParB/RepB/Spo0J family partition protein